MSSHTLQENFESYANSCLFNANNVIERSDNINAMFLQLDRLALLLSMYSRVQQFYDDITYRMKLEDINFIIRKLYQRIEILNNDSISTNRTFIRKVKTGGRPKTVIDESIVKLLRQLDYNWSDISRIFDVSEKTLSRMRKDSNLTDTIQPYSTFSNNELDEIIKKIKQENPFFGQVMIMGALRSKGIRVTRQCLRESIQRVDAFGAIIRWTQIIPRRRYHVAGPNAL